MKPELSTITAETLEVDIDNFYESKRKQWSQHTNRASNLGSCMRQLVYLRTVPEKGLKPESFVVRIFEEGNTQEEAVITLLRSIGYMVSKNQRQIDHHPELKRANITGHTDLEIEKHGYKPKLIEVKSMSEHVFRTVNSIEDFKKYPWTKKYMAQIQLYMFGTGYSEALFFLKEKGRNQEKIIPVSLDMKQINTLIEKAHMINLHVKEGTLPERDLELDACGMCNFNHVCCPDQSFSGTVFLSDMNLEKILSERAEIEKHVKAFKKLDDQAKFLIKKYEGDKILIGNYEIKISRIETKEKFFPKDTIIPGQKRTTVRIKKVKKDNTTMTPSKNMNVLQELKKAQAVS